MKITVSVLLLLLIAGCDDPWGPGISIAVTQPPSGGATADQSYVIMWTLDDQGYDDGSIDLFVDDDTDPSSGLIMIVDSLSLESTGYLWDCSNYPENSYYVRAVMRVGYNTTSDYSEGTITIVH